MLELLFLAAILFFLFMVWFYLSLFIRYHDQLHDDPPVKKFERISFVIPAYNEEKSIAQTIESILALNWPQKPFDIIVVNDGSTDRTAEKVKPFLKQGVRLLNQKNQGKATALNQRNGFSCRQARIPWHILNRNHYFDRGQAHGFGLVQVLFQVSNILQMQLNCVYDIFFYSFVRISLRKTTI